MNLESFEKLDNAATRLLAALAFGCLVLDLLIDGAAPVTVRTLTYATASVFFQLAASRGAR